MLIIKGPHNQESKPSLSSSYEVVRIVSGKMLYQAPIFQLSGDKHADLNERRESPLVLVV